MQRQIGFMGKQMRNQATCVVSLIFFLASFIGSGLAETISHEELFSMSLKALMDIEVEVVTAGKTPERIADIPASVVLIQRDDIERYGYTTLEEILSHIPGLYPTDDYSYDGVNFGVRGFWTGVVSRNVILLVNGVNQVNDYQGNFPLVQMNVPVEAIDRIEVIRGPMSVIYGAGAFFGVINIITNDVSNYDQVSLVDVSLGTQGTKKVMARTQVHSGDFQYVVNASLSSTDGIDQPLSKMIDGPLSNYGLSQNRTTGGTLEKEEKYFNFSGKSKNLFLHLSSIETRKEQYFSLPAVSDGGPQSIHRTNLSIGYEKYLTDKLNMKTQLTYQNSCYNTDYDLVVDNFDMEQTIGVTAYEIETNLFYNFRDDLDVTGGLYYRSATDVYNDVVSTSIGDSTLLHAQVYVSNGSHISLKAFYSQFNYLPAKFIRIVAGFRLEQMPKYDFEQELAALQSYAPTRLSKETYTYDKWKLIPRVAVLLTVNENNLIKLLYGEAINRPSFQQNIDRFSGFQSELQPEKIRTYEVNYIASFIPSVTTSINVFRNELEDLLIRNVELEPTYQSYFSNIGEMKTNGVEVNLKAKLFAKFLFDLSGTYQVTKDNTTYKGVTRPNTDASYSPDLLGYAKISYQNKQFTFSTTARYVDSMRPYWDPTKKVAEGIYGAYIGEDVPGYISLGCNIRVDNLFDRGIFVNLKCNNLLDEDIYYPTYTYNDWATKGTLGMGRSILFTIGLKK